MIGALGPISVVSAQGGMVQIRSVVGNVDHTRGLDWARAMDLASRIMDAAIEARKAQKRESDALTGGGDV